MSAVIADCQPTLALTTAAIAARLEEADLPCLVPDFEAASAWREPNLNGETLAFLQYTSGSTAAPKGVEVTHANVLANHAMIGAAFEQTEDFTIVSWLPLFHDMGLIGTVLQGLLAGNHCVLMAPEAFLMKPLRWLRAVARYGARASGGPNFAYDLCARKITPQQCEELDLSGWKLAFCGAEPVRAQTLERFAAAFAPCGLAPSAFYPCYGLAEATLFAAGGSKNAAPVVAGFDAAQLENGRAQLARGHETNARALVSCGRAWLDGEVWIVDADSLAPRAPGEIGEIWLRGPHVARGYWNSDAQTRAVFGAVTASGDGPFLRTGDLGFMREGELFVTGRIKDLIIIGGRNHAAGDIEATVEASHAALRAGGCAAFGMDVENSEVLAVVAEVERASLWRTVPLASQAENRTDDRGRRDSSVAGRFGSPFLPASAVDEPVERARTRAGAAVSARTRARSFYRRARRVARTAGAVRGRARRAPGNRVSSLGQTFFARLRRVAL